ncbi:MAG TPA: 3-dehydroquinate synthase [Chloroflexota bacterium]|nr:3-dehydroquinate synthase [Chloroflexota bacterium]
MMERVGPAADEPRSGSAEPGLEPVITLRFPGAVSATVYSGSGILRAAGALLCALPRPPRRVIVCADTAVRMAQGPQLRAGLEAAGLAVEEVTITPGEEQKNLATVMQCYSHFAQLGVERADVVLALGGGVVGDLFGFVAATYLRGLRLVQVPTTVVAQVDSSIGGKVGVDLAEGKNLVGAFKHPEFVLIDHATLGTLPNAEWISGTAEVAKHGVIADAALFEALERDPDGWRTRRHAPDAILGAALFVKARIVQQDERETGVRMHLNYGHTLGHALEQAAEYRGVRHGEAVAWGMAMAARLAAALGHSSQAFVRRQDRLLAALGLLRPLPVLDAERVFSTLFRDKKVESGKLRWILPMAEPGAVAVRDDVPLDLVRQLVAETVAGRLLSDSNPAP